MRAGVASDWPAWSRRRPLIGVRHPSSHLGVHQLILIPNGSCARADTDFWTDSHINAVRSPSWAMTDLRG